MQRSESYESKVAKIVKDSGGEVIGRTRLQKLAYLLELAGVGDGFEFEYRHYGPYSKDLADASRRAALLDLITEEEKETEWGGFYSIYRCQPNGNAQVAAPRQALLKLALQADSVVLELAATAAFLAANYPQPWEETMKRKPRKAAGRISKAKDLYRKILTVVVPNPLPNIL